MFITVIFTSVYMILALDRVVYVFIRLRNLGELIKYRNITTGKTSPSWPVKSTGPSVSVWSGGGRVLRRSGSEWRRCYLAALAGFYNLTNSSFKDINYVKIFLLCWFELKL